MLDSSLQVGLSEACISSSVRPLVSGTNFATNTTVKALTLVKMKNVPEQENHIINISI